MLEIYKISTLPRLQSIYQIINITRTANLHNLNNNTNYKWNKYYVIEHFFTSM